MSQKRSKNDAGPSSQPPSSQSKRKRKSSQANDESDEGEAGPSQSQSQSGLKDKLWVTMPQEERRMYVNMLISFMLARDVDKVTAKRADINDIFKKAGKTLRASIINSVIEEAREKLVHAYGFDIVEASTDLINDDVQSQAASQSKQAPTKFYMLVNVLKPPPGEQQHQAQADQAEGREDDAAEEAKNAFTRERAEMFELGGTHNASPHFELAMTIMAVIALNRYSISEPDLWDVLRELGIVKGVEHPVFGPPDRAIRELCDQGYIHMKKVKDADDKPQVVYCLGLRAGAEVGRKQILSFVEETFGEKMLASTRKDLLQEGVEDDDE